MTRNFAQTGPSRPRIIIARLLAVFLALQSFIPGVLAYSAADEGLWCRSVAAAEPGRSLPAAGQEPCIVCAVMATGHTPLPPANVVLPAPVAAVEVMSFAIARHVVPVAPGNGSHPIRGPPCHSDPARPDWTTPGVPSPAA